MCVNSNKSTVEAFEAHKNPQNFQAVPVVQKACFRKMSLRHDLAYACVMLSFCMLSATMQILRSTHAKMQTTLSLALSLSATRIQPPSLADFMDVHCLTFTPPLLPVFFFLFLPSFLSPFSLCRLLSGISSRLTSLAVTLDFKGLLHSSVTHQREGHSALR